MRKEFVREKKRNTHTHSELKMEKKEDEEMEKKNEKICLYEPEVRQKIADEIVLNYEKINSHWDYIKKKSRVTEWENIILQIKNQMLTVLLGVSVISNFIFLSKLRSAH